MTSEYIEERNGGYYIAGTRISLDSVVYSFERGNSPEAIRQSFPLLKLSQIYGAIAFYLDHQTELDEYLAHNEATEEEFSREIARLFPKGAALKERIKEHSLQPVK